jgi:hypothetical protein
METYLGLKPILLISLVYMITPAALENKLKFGLMGMGYRPYGPPFKIPYLGSALPIALDDVENDPHILPNYTFSFITADSGCDPRSSVGHMVTMVRDEHVDAIIGPTCAEACESLSYLASSWNIPVISYSCWSEELSNKRMFDTFARTVSVFSELAKVLASVMNEYNWRDVGLMYDTSAGYQEIAADAVIKYLPTRNVSLGAVEKYDFPIDDVETSYFLEPLRNIAHVCRGEVSLCMCVTFYERMNYTCSCLQSLVL